MAANNQMSPELPSLPAFGDGNQQIPQEEALAAGRGREILEQQDHIWIWVSPLPMEPDDLGAPLTQSFP